MQYTQRSSTICLVVLGLFLGQAHRGLAETASADIPSNAITPKSNTMIERLILSGKAVSADRLVQRSQRSDTNKTNQEHTTIEAMRKNPGFDKRYRKAIETSCMLLLQANNLNESTSQREAALLRLNQINIEGPLGEKIKKFVQSLNGMYFESTGMFSLGNMTPEIAHALVLFFKSISETSDQYSNYLEQAGQLHIPGIDRIIAKEAQAGFILAKDNNFMRKVVKALPKWLTKIGTIDQSVILGNTYNQDFIKVLDLLGNGIASSEHEAREAFKEASSMINKYALISRTNSLASSYYVSMFNIYLDYEEKFNLAHRQHRALTPPAPLDIIGLKPLDESLIDSEKEKQSQETTQETPKVNEQALEQLPQQEAQ
jgi:hypothetical protein